LIKKAIPFFIGIGSLVLLLILWAIFGTSIRKSYYQWSFQQSQERGQIDDAALLLEKQIQLDPSNPTLRLDAVKFYENAKMYVRAEYHLKQTIALGGQHLSDLYRDLSRLYVLQDKLMDSVSLLDSVHNLSESAVASMRPSPPVPNIEPGEYETAVSLEFEVSPGVQIYFSVSHEYPSTLSEAAQPIDLPIGTTVVQAVAVNQEGMVSTLFTGQYILRNVNLAVEFADENMELLLRSTIGKPTGDVYTRELAQITVLTSEEDTAFTNLDDLVWLTRLQVLRLQGTGSFCSIASLSELTTMQDLSLTNFALDSVDIQALTSLTALQTLSLAENNLTSLTALSGLQGLDTLNLSRNSVIDALPLVELVKLKHLDLSHNSLSDLSALAGFEHLVDLNISGNRITDLYGLENLLTIESLDVSTNYLRNLDPLTEWRHLKTLNASNNELASLAGIRQDAALRYIDVNTNALVSLAALESLDGLQTLIANNNFIDSVVYLQYCTSLETLDLSKNQIETLESIRGLPALKELRIEQNNLVSLAPLLDCPSLKSVVGVFGNKITDVSALTILGINVA
jgi:internalin A